MTFETLQVLATIINLIFCAWGMTRFVKFVIANSSLIWAWMKEDAYWLVPAFFLNCLIIIILL